MLRLTSLTDVCGSWRVLIRRAGRLAQLCCVTRSEDVVDTEGTVASGSGVASFPDGSVPWPNARS